MESEKGTITLKEIVAEYLKTNGYDGLYYGHRYCECILAHDFDDCNAIVTHCRPGYINDCPTCVELKKCAIGKSSIHIGKPFTICWRGED